MLPEQKKGWEYSVSENGNDYLYNFIDIFKFICALLVVCIHINIFPNSEIQILKGLNFTIKQIVSRIAVPFYFTASGFLFFRKVDVNNLDFKLLSKYLVKNLKLYALWTILFFLGGNYQLWYMKGLVVATGIIFILLKIGVKPKIIFCISIMLYIVGLLGDSYYGFLSNFNFLSKLFFYYNKYFSTTRNGVFMGLPFVAVGLLFAKCNIKLKKPVAILGVIVSFGLLFSEAILLKLNDIPKDYNMYVFLYPLNFFIFYSVTHIRIKDNPMYGLLRNAGILIYCSHIFWCQIVNMGYNIFSRIFSFQLPDLIFQPVIFIVTLTLTVLFAVFTEKISAKHNKLKWFYT